MKTKEEIIASIIDRKLFNVGQSISLQLTEDAKNDLKKQIDKQLDYLLPKLNPGEEVILPGFFNQWSLNENETRKKTLVLFTNQGIVVGHAYTYSKGFLKYIEKLLGDKESIVFERLSYSIDIHTASRFTEILQNKYMSPEAKGTEMYITQIAKFKTPQGVLSMNLAYPGIATQLFEQQGWLIAQTYLLDQAKKDNNTEMINGLTKMVNTTKGTIEALDWKLNLSNLIISLTVYRCKEEIIEEVKKMSSAREFEEKYPELYLMHYKK